MNQSVLEMAPVQEQDTTAVRNVADPDFYVTPEAAFTNAELFSLHQDDAMAGGMIAIILSFAFVVLLTLAVGVNVWMAMIST